MADQLTLDVDLFVVHCIFNLTHVVRAQDPDIAHDAMERHYAAKHTPPTSRRCSMPELLIAVHDPDGCPACGGDGTVNHHNGRDYCVDCGQVVA